VLLSRSTECSIRIRGFTGTAGEPCGVAGIKGFLGAKPYVVPATTLTRHYVIHGPTGSGKSVLLTNLAYQIAALPERPAIVVIDIKDGTLCEDILRVLPSARLSDCVYFDIADTGYPVAFSPLAGVPPQGRTLAAAELITCFKRLFDDAWGPRLEYVLLMVLLTLLETPAATLIDVPRLLTDERYRAWAVPHVTNFSVQNFWGHDFPAIVGRGGSTANVQSILNKLGIFAFEQVRNVLGQGRPGIDVRACMDAGKILLCNFPQGIVGEAACTFLASLMATRVQLAAQARADTPRERRRLTVLVADEFQNFVAAGGTFEKCVTEGRSLALGILAACQFDKQLPPLLRLTLEKNCQYRLVCSSQGPGHVVRVTPLQTDHPDELTVETRALPPIPNTNDLALRQVRDATRRLFARPRAEVEAAIHDHLTTTQDTTQRHEETKPSKEAAYAHRFFEEA